MLALLFVLVPAVPARAAATCGEVTLVFARGSGQRMGSTETSAFFAAISARLGSPLRTTAYELGTSAYGGGRYPAVGVGIDSEDAFKNLLAAVAFWSGGEGDRYRASVKAGTTELRGYLAQRLAACPGERFVLGGFSQGAEVIGDALPQLSRAVRDRIAFVTLFGDPKLSLPEGKGVFPAACRGANLSPWRRGTVGCSTDSGILEARQPYVPADLRQRVGSWCDRDDPICNDNLADLVHSTHGQYAKAGGAVEQAAREAAAAVRGALGQGIDVSVAG